MPCSPPIELDLSPFQDNIQATFLIANYLSRSPFGRKTVLETWHTISPLDCPSRRALEATFFGRVHHRQDICETGSLWYGKALRKLARDLGDPEKMWSVSLLRSTVILTMHEVQIISLTFLTVFRLTLCHDIPHRCFRTCMACKRAR